jgi:hypothetical protein
MRASPWATPHSTKAPSGRSSAPQARNRLPRRCMLTIVRPSALMPRMSALAAQPRGRSRAARAQRPRRDTHLPRHGEPGLLRSIAAPRAGPDWDMVASSRLPKAIAVLYASRPVVSDGPTSWGRLPADRPQPERHRHDALPGRRPIVVEGGGAAQGATITAAGGRGQRRVQPQVAQRLAFPRSTSDRV